MKINSKFIITTLLLSFLSMVAMAKDLSTFTIKTVDKNSFVIELNNVKQPQIQVTLKDIKGVVLLEETMAKNSFQQKINLKELPIGNYTLIIDYDTVIKMQPIKKTKEMLEINAENLQTIFKPAFKQHAEYMDLNMFCLANFKISLEIYDYEGRIIYSELIKQKGTLQRRFNLGRLEKGSYTFSVGIVDKVLNKEFKEYIDWSPALASL